jgi:hypothetical protein
MTTRYTSSVARRAVVKSVNYADGTLTTRWLDDDSDGPVVPIPHPFGNKGGSGIFVGIKVGTVIVLVMASYKNYIPVAVIPTIAYYSDMSEISESDYDDLSFPTLSAGDIVVQGPTGSVISLGSGLDEVVVVNEFGEGTIIGGGSDSFRCSMNVAAPTNYTISQYGIKASGIVRRDVKIEETEDSFIDFLTALDSEQSLEEVGWHPEKQISYSSGGTSQVNSGDFGRNPPYVEDRQMIYEFGRNWMVGSIEEEKSKLSACNLSTPSSTDRSERRSNALSLSLANPNELIEKISGTVVDIFGNPLDINRKIIVIKSASDIDAGLKNTLEGVRHGIAYHMEINARKGIRFNKKQSTKKPELFESWSESISSTSNNARDRSRWFIDVDKEGLTKINIPATSETGNVPIITRYENSSVLNIDSKGNSSISGRNKVEDTKKLYRNEKNRDIFIEQVGPGGIKILGDPPDNRMGGKKTSWVETDSTTPSGSISQTKMPTNIESGTAFHNITKTAWALIKENINNSASGWALIVEKDKDAPTPAAAGLMAVSNEINPEPPKDNVTTATQNPNNSGLLQNQPNAGGRSVHLNLDGCLETSIGANTIDRVSWILDTAGALIWRLGRDRSGRSAIVHADGTIALEVGGFDYIGKTGDDEVDTRFVGRGELRDQVLKLDPNQFRSGKLVVKVRRATTNKAGPEPDDTILIIDETGVTITTPGRLNFVSGQEMTFSSKGLMTLDAPKIQLYKNPPKYVARTARIIK